VDNETKERLVRVEQMVKDLPCSRMEKLVNHEISTIKNILEVQNKRLKHLELEGAREKGRGEVIKYIFIPLVATIVSLGATYVFNKILGVI